jgi:murein DD-endopeptidase MepM/ murein hydrolase activator NlpD
MSVDGPSGRCEEQVIMKTKYLLRAISLLVLFVSLLPSRNAGALAQIAPPPVDMFQLPWDLGIAWVALDGIDNGSKRPASSPHNFRLGGAIDFAPRRNMITGENTSNFWVTAAAAGTVIEKATCYVTIAHANGWITQYQFLGNVQVNLGDTVARNQRLGIIADGVRHQYCPGFQEINVPHVHFILRPSIIGATLAGWEVKYNQLFNRTTFTKGSTTVGLFQPLLNVMDSQATPTPTATSLTPVGSTTPTSSTPVGSHTPTASTPVGSLTPTPSGPHVSITVNPQNIIIGETALATVSLNNVPAGGYTSAEFTCTYNPSVVEVSNITVANLFGADPAVAINGPQNGTFIVAVAGNRGNKATTSGTAFTFNAEGLQAGQTTLACNARVSTGNNVLTAIGSTSTTLNVLSGSPTPTSTPTSVASSTPSATPVPNTPTSSPTPSVPTTPVEPTNTPNPSVTPGGPTPTFTPTANVSDWLTFTNATYGFQFKYPPQGQIVSGGNDNFTRINLPFTPGTNLSEKYLEVVVVENANPCRSPLATTSILETSETVVINGISFLKETGGDAGAGHIHQWVAYSTLRNNACVSLDFILHSLNPGNFPTPPPVFDYAAESAVFGHIVSTYTWLTSPTATPTATQSTPVGTATPTSSTPVQSPTPTPSTPIGSPTSTSIPGGSGIVTGQVLASKPVTVSLYDTTNTLVTSASANANGTFTLLAPVGTYTVRATASGFLSAQGSVTLTSGSTSTMPNITLLAGDIDGNNVIDQLDAMTIGMNYNTASPAAADLNNDGIINVLDLELLAENYRKTGPLAWQ